MPIATMFDFLTKRKLPVSVITGFLGSGKTTLLNRLLSHPKFKNTAVIINEFGDVGIDHLLVKQVDEQMVMLSKGCVCCTVRADIVTTLRELLSKRARGEIPKFKRILIETTGLADPAPVIHALTHSPLAKKAIYLDTVITTIDAVHAEQTLSKHEELIRQIAVADVLVMTKTDQVSTQQAVDVKRLVQNLNPSAEWLESVQGELPPETFFGKTPFDPRQKKPNVDQWLSIDPKVPPHSHDHKTQKHKHHDIETFTIIRDQPLSMQAFQLFHSTLLNFRDSNILRIKGILNIKTAEGPVLIHGVQHVLSPPQWLTKWPSDDRRSRMVFITKGVTKESIECLLMGFERSANAELRHVISNHTHPNI